MFGSFVISNILNYAGEYETYLFVHFSERVKQRIKEIVKTDSFKWLYLLRKYSDHNEIHTVLHYLKRINDIEFIYSLMEKFPERYNENSDFFKKIKKTNSLEVIKFLFPKNIEFLNKYLKSDNIEVIKFMIENGSYDCNLCLKTDNLEIAKLGIENGATNFDNCLLSDNFEVVKLGIENGATKFDRCLWSNNIEIVKLGIKKGAESFSNCLKSDNLEVVKLGIEKGAKYFKNCFGSSNIEAIKLCAFNPEIFNLHPRIKNIETLKFVLNEKPRFLSMENILSNGNIEVILIGLKLSDILRKESLKRKLI